MQLEERSPRASRETVALAMYAVAYVAYLFWNPEGELFHWITLVAIPAGVVAVAGRYRSQREVLRSVGLTKQTAQGWWLAGGFAIAFQVIQLANRTQRATLSAVFSAPSRLYVVPLAFVLLLGTAATTEEFFFRGLLQTRFATVCKSEAAGVALATLAFIAYHVPYAYLKWPSAGNARAAWEAAVTNALVAGVPLGLVYWRSRHNLLPAIFLHASIDLLPAVGMLASRFGMS